MKKILSFVFVAMLVLSIIAPVFAEENTKADFGFSLSGGSYKGKTSWMGEFYLAQNWHISKGIGFFFQATGMAYVYDAKKPWENGEYGASAGLGFEFYPWENVRIGAYAFADSFGKNRFLFAQVRPTLMIASSRFKLLGGVAFHLTKPLIISTVVSEPIFWADNAAYYYDIRTTREIAETIDYWFVRGEAIWPLKFVKFFGEYIQGMNQYKNIQRIQLGAELKIFKWLSAEIEWFKTQTPGVYLTKWFDQNDFRGAIHLDPFAAAEKFADFIQRKFVEVFWPVVITRGEERFQTTKITDVITGELKTNKKVYCKDETVEAIGTAFTGTLPLTGYFDFSDGAIISTEITELNKPISAYHKYSQPGEYCIKFTIKDQFGHETTYCVCIKVEKCGDKPGCVEADKAKATVLKADKYSIKEGEEVTITGETKKALKAILNADTYFVNKSETPNTKFTEKFKPSKTVKVNLKTENDCPSEDSRTITILVDECKDIVTQDTDLRVSPLSVKVGEEVTVTVNMAQYATGVKLYKDGVQVATEPGTYKYTFTDPGATHIFRAFWENDCSSKELVRTVTVEACDKCSETEVKESGSDTYAIPNIPAGSYKKTITVTNEGYCNWSNFLVRAKMEKQQGSTLLARNEFTFNLPAKSQVSIEVAYNDSTKKIAFTVLSTTSLLKANNSVVQCQEYYKMTIATECGANF